ncbi:hypothetical protein L9F63_019481, partial [Diploptera punctata]
TKITEVVLSLRILGNSLPILRKRQHSCKTESKISHKFEDLFSALSCKRRSPIAFVGRTRRRHALSFLRLHYSDEPSSNKWMDLNGREYSDAGGSSPTYLWLSFSPEKSGSLNLLISQEPSKVSSYPKNYRFNINLGDFIFHHIMLMIGSYMCTIL